MTAEGGGGSSGVKRVCPACAGFDSERSDERRTDELERHLRVQGKLYFYNNLGIKWLLPLAFF